MPLLVMLSFLLCLLLLFLLMVLLELVVVLLALLYVCLWCCCRRCFLVLLLCCCWWCCCWCRRCFGGVGGGVGVSTLKLFFLHSSLTSIPLTYWSRCTKSVSYRHLLNADLLIESCALCLLCSAGVLLPFFVLLNIGISYRIDIIRSKCCISNPGISYPIEKSDIDYRAGFRFDAHRSATKNIRISYRNIYFCIEISNAVLVLKYRKSYRHIEYFIEISIIASKHWIFHNIENRMKTLDISFHNIEYRIKTSNTALKARISYRNMELSCRNFEKYPYRRAVAPIVVPEYRVSCRRFDIDNSIPVDCYYIVLQYSSIVLELCIVFVVIREVDATLILYGVYHLRSYIPRAAPRQKQ